MYGSVQMKVLGFNDSCQEGERSRFQRWGSLGEDGTGVSQNMARTIDILQESLSNLEDCMTRIETQYRQSAARMGSISDDVCCNACVRVADGLSMNIRNVNTLYNALLSKGLLTDKGSENLITNFQDGRQVVGPLFSTPSTGPKGKNGIISFASPVDVHSWGG